MGKCHKCNYNKYLILDPITIDKLINFTIYTLLFFLVSNRQSTRIIQQSFDLSKDSTEYVSSVIFGITYIITEYVMTNSKL